MKSFSDDALAALERGDAIVSASVEIIPGGTSTYSTTIFEFDASFDYQIINSVVDADPVEDIVVPSTGFDSTGIAPFGAHGTGPAPTPLEATAWLKQTSLWLKRDIVIPADGTLTFTGFNENGCVIFIDDLPVGSVNADGADLGGGSYSISAAVTAGAHTVKVLCLDEALDKGPTDITYFWAQAVLSVDTGVVADPIRLWGGYGTMDLPADAGTEPFYGIGDRAMVANSSGAIGGTAQALVITLSGIEAKALEVLDANDVKDASVVVRRLIFDNSGKTLLGAYVYSRGRVDTLSTEFEVGGPAAIQMAVEGAARSLGRRGGRIRSDADQRLVKALDGFFRMVSWAAQKTLYWGGKKPATTG